MTRVIAGVAAGRRLAVPPGDAVRPTSDRVKEALFSSLAGRLRGAVVLDLFAGGGGLGIEALSRGATTVVFVEQDRRVAAVLRRNLETVGLVDRATVVTARARRFCREPVGGPFDLVLADPPYAVGEDEVVRLLTALVAALAPEALVVVERSRHGLGDATAVEGLRHAGDTRYGDTILRRYMRGSPS